MSVLTKSVDGKEHPASDFAYVGDPQDIATWHLPVFDEGHARDALGRFDQAQMPDASKRRGALHKVLAACKKFGIDAAGFEKDHHAMMGLGDQWLDIFRAGDYGNKGSYTPADIDKIVANYDTAAHEAPVVVGHPELDAPAFGWVEKLRRVGDVLQAKLGQVHEGFEQMVREGRFKKRSVALYPDKLALRHLSFLGAHPPEVKGLADAKFDERQGVFQAIEFNEEAEMQPEEIKRSIMDGIREFFSGDKKAPKFSEEDLQQRVAEALKPLQTKVTEFTEAEKKRQAADSGAARTKAAETAIARVKEKKRWLPAFDKLGLPQLFSELAKSDVKVTFGEGDKKTEKTLVDVFADFMCALPEMVPGGELVLDGHRAARKSTVKFNESKSIDIDLASVELRDAAQKRSAERKISFGEALRELRAEGFQPVAGGASAGAV